MPWFVRFETAVDMAKGPPVEPNLTLPLRDVKVTALGHEGDPIEGVQLRYSTTWKAREGASLGGGTEVTGVTADDETVTKAEGISDMAVPSIGGTIEVYVARPQKPSWAMNWAKPSSRSNLKLRHTPSSSKSLLDTTAPEVQCSSPPTGWQDANVSIQCYASDDGSGLREPAQAAFTLSTDVSAGQVDESAETPSARVCDRADNCTAVKPFGHLRSIASRPKL